MRSILEKYNFTYTIICSAVCNFILYNTCHPLFENSGCNPDLIDGFWRLFAFEIQFEELQFTKVLKSEIYLLRNK